MSTKSILFSLLAEYPSVGDFDADEHQEICGDSETLQRLRARQETVGDGWGDDTECKALVGMLQKARKEIDRESARQDWIKSNPEAYEAEQQLLSSEGKPVE